MQEFLFQDFYESKDGFSESLKLLIKRRELEEKVRDFEYIGYAYIKHNLEFKSDMIYIPSRGIITEKEINEELNPLKFGDKDQMKYLEHLEYLQLAREYYDFKFL